MAEQTEVLSRLQKSLSPYISSRQEVSHIRQVLALHLRHTLQLETNVNKDGRGSWPLSLQEVTGHVKSSSSRGLRKDYIKSLRVNSKVRQEYANTTSECLGQRDDASTSKKYLGDSSQDLENPLHDYVLLLEQRRRIEKLQIIARYIDLFDQKPPASSTFLDCKSFSEGIDPLPSVPSTILNETIDRGSSAKSVTELVHQLEKAVLQAKFQLDVEKRQTIECKSRLAEQEKTMSRANIKQRLEALGRTRNDMILWMEEQLGKTGDDLPEDANEAKVPQSKASMESQLIRIQKEYRKYVIARQELLMAVRIEADGLKSTQQNEAVGKLQISHNTLETIQPTDPTHPYLAELLSISNEQKSQILQRSYLNTCLAKQQKENMQSMDRLAEESHLLPMYPMSTSRTKRQAERPDSLSGMLIGNERPGIVKRARGWVFAADAAGKATRDAVLEKVEEGRSAVDESLHTLLGLHQLLDYDVDDTGDDANEEDIWASPKKIARKDEGSRTDIWSKLDGNLGVIRRENE